MTRINIAAGFVIVASWVAILLVWLFTLGPFTTANSTNNTSLPFFYNISPDDLIGISITYQDKNEAWEYNEDLRRWVFANAQGIPVNPTTWGGVTTLLSGPRLARISDTIGDPSLYGLDDPETIISLTLRNGFTRVINLGNVTPDGTRHYASASTVDGLALVDATWGQVLNNLVTNPPYPVWVYDLDPTSVRELILFLGDEVVRAYGKDQDTNQWHICDLPVRQDPCLGDVPADNQAIQDNLALIADSKITSVAALSITTPDQFATYGTTRESPYVRIRVENIADSGVTEVTGVTINFGDISDDGRSRYAVINETEDVVLVDRSWADKVIARLFTDSVLLGDG